MQKHAQRPSPASIRAPVVTPAKPGGWKAENQNSPLPMVKREKAAGGENGQGAKPRKWPNQPGGGDDMRRKSGCRLCRAGS